MTSYHIKNKDEEELFFETISEALAERQGVETEKIECHCPLCMGKIEIIRSSRIKNYMFAICNSCGAGAFN